MLLPALGAFLIGILLYQLPHRTTVAIGSLGDQLFVRGSEALDAASEAEGRWYSDELGAGRRSRWTRSLAYLRFSDVGGGDTAITLRVQGWPADVAHPSLRQPVVTARVGAGPDAPVVGEFTPTSEWGSYTVWAPAAARRSADLTLQLAVSDTFTRTAEFAGDPRPKGIRVDQVTLETAQPSGLLRVGWSAVLQLAGVALVGGLAAQRRTARRGLAALFGAGLATSAVTLLLLWRLWTAALLPLGFGLACALLVIAWRDELRGLGRGIETRLRIGRAVTSGAVVALVGCALLLAASAAARFAVPDLGELLGDSDRLVQLLPPVVAAGLLIAAGPTVLPEGLRSLRRRLLAGWLTPALLAVAGGVIIGWQLQLLREIPIVGHADYADNAVVARSLVRGQGWTVPYVTQFYELVPGGSVYRPQETWPLLQPLWMAPWMALLGATAFAARLPNIVFNLALLLLVYHIGATLWDRRVGLLAAALTLLNHLFFLLTIFSTTDLGFTVLSMAALWLFYRAWEFSADGAAVIGVSAGSEAHGRLDRLKRSPSVRWALAGLLTGLMMLQKPTGAIFGVGMGLWAVVCWWRARDERRPWQQLGRFPWRGVLLWAGISTMVISPYLARNLLLFGKPVFSTESYDAWILGYAGTRGEAWEEIYRVYLGDLPNRSWILRAGWDRTLGKLLTQVDAVRDYLLPPTGGLLGANRKYEGSWLGVRLASTAPTWLALLGLLSLRRRQRPLIGLVALAGIIYTIFLATYWHANEPRYFVPFVPWLLLLAMGALCAGFDRALAYRGGRWAGLAGGLALLLLWSTVQPQLNKTDAFLDPASLDYWGRDWLPDLAAHAWLRDHTRPDDVIMTRVPWQLSFAADRPSLMIPNAPLTADDPRTPTIMQVARYYGADYLVLNAMTGPGPVPRTALRPLSQGRAIAGFELVYAGTEGLGRNPIYIYRFPADYAGAGPLGARIN